MLKYLLITIYLYEKSCNADGELSIIDLPESIKFIDDKDLPASAWCNIIGTTLGIQTNSQNDWFGIDIKDPFNCPKHVVTILIDGIQKLQLNYPIKTYQIIGNDFDYNINLLSINMKKYKFKLINFNLNNGINDIQIFYHIFGSIDIRKYVKYNEKNYIFKPDIYVEDKLFLEKIGIINAIADRINKHRTDDINAFVIDLSLRGLVREHGRNSVVVIHAVKLLSDAIGKLAKTLRKIFPNDFAFYVATTNEDLKRFKRDDDDDATVDPNAAPPAPAAPGADGDDDDINLSQPYDEDYASIFNIMLWFMVAFAFSLTAIAFAMIDMDPGRDNIVYRMTTPRLKKEA